MIFADHAGEDPNILGITDLHQQGTTPLVYIALQDVVAIFGDPDHMHGQPGHTMAGMAIGFLGRLCYHRYQNVQLKVLH